MTTLLQRALRRVESLPPDDQDAIAAQILESLDDDAAWEQSFQSSGAALDKLVEEAVEERRRGETAPSMNSSDELRHFAALPREVLGTAAGGAAPSAARLTNCS